MTKLFFIAILCLPAFAQPILDPGSVVVDIQKSFPVVPHLTSPDGGFASEIIVENDSEFTQPLTLVGFSADGLILGTSQTMIEAGTILRLSPEELFGTDQISHLWVQQFFGFFSALIPPKGLEVSVRYGFRDGIGSPARVPQTTDRALRWRLFPGNWEQTWDGIAVLNASQEPATVRARQLDSEGQLIEERVVEEALDANAKALFVLSTSFADVPGASFEIVADQPVYLTALRGNEEQYLWAVDATLVEALEPRITLFEVPSSVTLGEDLTIRLRAEGLENLSARFTFVDPFVCVGCERFFSFRVNPSEDITVLNANLNSAGRYIVTLEAEGSGGRIERSALFEVLEPNSN